MGCEWGFDGEQLFAWLFYLDFGVELKDVDLHLIVQDIRSFGK